MEKFGLFSFLKMWITFLVKMLNLNALIGGLQKHPIDFNI